MEKEIWKPLIGFKINSSYEISNYGKIVSLNYWHLKGRRQERLWNIGKKGYLKISIQGRSVQAHRAVALAFIPNPNNYDQINHKDGNKQNNYVGNLEWCNSKMNVQHSLVNGIAKRASGERRPNAYLTESIVKQIRSEYRPNVYGLRKILAKKYNTTKGNIGTIISGKSWKHLL